MTFTLRSFTTDDEPARGETSTGEVVWTDQARSQQDSTKVSVFGVGGGVDDNRMFDKVMKPAIKELVASLVKVAVR